LDDALAASGLNALTLRDGIGGAVVRLATFDVHAKVVIHADERRATLLQTRHCMLALELILPEVFAMEKPKHGDAQADEPPLTLCSVRVHLLFFALARRRLSRSCRD
jgi:hypothetical protein